MVHAKYIHPDKSKLMAVFDKGTPLADVELMAMQLSDMPNTVVEVGVGYTDQEPEVIILTVDLRHLANVQEAATRLRETTQPELRITLSRLTLTLKYCVCGIPSIKTAIAAVIGLRPENPETFLIEHHQRMSSELAKPSGEPFYTQLRKAAHKALHEIGAYAASVRVEVTSNPLPCSHAK